MSFLRICAKVTSEKVKRYRKKIYYKPQEFNTLVRNIFMVIRNNFIRMEERTVCKCLCTLCKVKLRTRKLIWHTIMNSPRNPFIIKKPSLIPTKVCGMIPLNSRGKTSCSLCNLHATVKKKRRLCPRYSFLQVNKRHLERGKCQMRYLINYRKKRKHLVLKKS